MTDCTGLPCFVGTNAETQTTTVERYLDLLNLDETMTGWAERGGMTDAYEMARQKNIHLQTMGVDLSDRNVLVTHQFVTGAATCESEELSVGGTDNVDVSVFDDFDYVALGHLHGPQNIGSSRVRYCGTPLKYSFSEAGHYIRA